jgi:hypothetical protein
MTPVVKHPASPTERKILSESMSFSYSITVQAVNKILITGEKDEWSGTAEERDEWRERG